MARPTVALLLSLGALLLLAGPATADSANGQGDGQANGNGQGQGNTSASEGSGTSGDGSSSGSSSGNATSGSGNSTAAASSPPPGGSTGIVARSAVACRVVGNHINDPRVPVTGWVKPDPDGCFQRIIYYALGIPPTDLVSQIRQRLPV